MERYEPYIDMIRAGVNMMLTHQGKWVLFTDHAKRVKRLEEAVRESWMGFDDVYMSNFCYHCNGKQVAKNFEHDTDCIVLTLPAALAGKERI